jgi:hypothetical protein
VPYLKLSSISVPSAFDIWILALIVAAAVIFFNRSSITITIKSRNTNLRRGYGLAREQEFSTHLRIMMRQFVP